MPSSTDPEHVSPDRLGCGLSFAFSGKSARNRFLKSSTGECMASFCETDIGRRGIPSAELVNLYRHWGEGSIGLVITGNVMIDCAHLVSAGDAIIPIYAPLEGLRFDRFSGIALEAKRHGSLVIAQLCHPGRQTPLHLQPFPISTGDVGIQGGNFGTDFGKPRPATKEDIDHIVKAFAHAAAYAERAGFDGIQLQAAHGHLLSQFLSPRTNKRQDSYGGNMKKRMRLISEIREAISERVAKDFIVGIKINAVEFQESAFGPEEADQLSIELEQRCFDFVELSGGIYEDWTMHHRNIASIQQHEAVS
jgi:2,4-dienoyl-CoA reductase-like NADH-dependent reductase (Old Yellow Enzyme family)